MSAPADDELTHKNVLQLVKSLESMDDLVVEAAQEALWYQEKHNNDIKLSAGKEDIERLQDTHNIYRNDYEMCDMLQYLANIRTNERLFDTLITSIIKVMDRTVQSERGQWIDWYERMQNAGDISWRKAIPASNPMASADPTGDTLNALTDKYASIDRALDVLNKYISIGRERSKFSDEHRDTMLAIVELSKARGPYAPLVQDEVNLVKLDLRRRRKTEAGQRHLASAPSAHPPVEKEETTAKPETLTLGLDGSIIQKWSSAITTTIAILFAVILAAIPGYKAWQHSTRQPGTAFDADFWFLVQSSMMQLIGLLTVMLPLALSGRLKMQKWFWTWLLSGISFSCSIAPIPVYLYFPKEWSATIAFLGSAAQIFVTLQALFGVQKQKTQ